MSKDPKCNDADSPNDGAATNVTIGTAIAEYLRLCQTNGTVDQDSFLARYPMHLDELVQFIRDHEQFARLANPVREWQSAISPETPPVRQLGDYQLLEEIGRGGMGIIYRARQTNLHRDVAVKMIPLHRSDSNNDRLRFRQEAEAAAALDHPNIIPVYDVGHSEGVHFFAMKLIEGGNLQDHVNSGLSIQSAAVLVGQVARAIHYAHLNGILHRDLKPTNILVESRDKETWRPDSSSGETNANAGNRSQPTDPSLAKATMNAYVTDFGLAKQVGFDGQLTATGAIFGTPNYMSPEQATSGAMTTPLTDVYGLGTILYYALTGVAPFRGADLLDVMEQVRRREPVPPQTINKDVNRDLETITLKCLEKVPDRRYESGLCVAEELERFLEGRPILARPAGLAEKISKWVAREPKLAGLALMSLLFVLAIIGGLIATNISTGIEQTKTKTALQNLTDEQRLTKRALLKSLISGSRAKRLGKRAGYRFHSLADIKKAIHLRNESGDDEFDQALVDELIASLAIPIDMLPVCEWKLEHFNPDPASFDFDCSFQRFATGCTDGRVTINSLETGKVIHELAAHPSRVCCVRFSPNGKFLAVVHEDRSFFLWDLEQPKPSLSFESRCEREAFDFLPDGTLLAVAVPGQSIEVVRLREGVSLAPKVIASFANSDRVASWLRFDGQGKHLAVLDMYQLRVIDFETRREKFHFDERLLKSVCFSPDGTLLAVSTNTGMIRVLDIAKQGLVQTMKSRWPSQNLEWLPNSAFLLSSSGQAGITTMWRGTRLESFLDVPGTFRRINKDGTRVGFRTEASIGVWEVAKSSCLMNASQFEIWGPARDVAFSSTHPIMATSGEYGLRIWNSKSLEPLADIRLSNVRWVCFHPVTGDLFTASGSGTWRWPVIEGERGALSFGPPLELETEQPVFAIPECMAISQNGDALAVGHMIAGKPKTLIYQTPFKKVWRSIPALAGPWSVSLSSNGALLASGNIGQRDVGIWDLESGLCIHKITAAEEAVVKFVGNNDLLISDGEQGTRRFQSDTWKVVSQIPSSFQQIAFDPANQRIGVAQFNGYLVMQDNPFQVLANLTSGKTGRYDYRIAFSPNGTFLAGSRGNDGMQVWDLAEVDRQVAKHGLKLPVSFRSLDSTMDSVTRCEILFSQPIRVAGTIVPVPMRGSQILPRISSNSRGHQVRGIPESRDFASLPSGEQDFAGVPFDVGNRYAAVSKGHSELVSRVRIPAYVKANRLHFLYGVSLRGRDAQIGEPLARFQINFEDGSTAVIPLIHGENTLHWTDPYSITNRSLDPVATIATTGNGRPGVIRIRSWANLHSEKVIESIELEAVHPSAATFCLAISSEQE